MVNRMTEKRFHYDRALEKIYDYDTCEDGIAESLDCFNACELLNELHEENKELRIVVDTLKKQNMKLKTRLIDLGVEYY